MKLYLLYAAIIISGISAFFMGYLLINQLHIPISLSLFPAKYAIKVHSSSDWVVYNATHPTRSPEQLEVFNAPNKLASQTDQENYIHSVASRAKEQNTLDLSTCYPSPVALKAKNNTLITVTNKSTHPHNLKVNDTYTYIIPAQGQKTISLSFSQIPGVYSFSCDSLKEPVGVFYITQ